MAKHHVLRFGALPIALVAFAGLASCGEPDPTLPTVNWKQVGTLRAVHGAEVWVDQETRHIVNVVGEDGIILNYDGNYWGVANRSDGIELRGVTRSASTWVAVGCVPGMSGGRILRQEGGVWLPVMTTPMPCLNAVTWAAGLGFVAVGDEGGVYRSDDAGRDWTRVTGLGSDALYSVSAADRSHLWGVGANGAMIHHDGITWTQFSNPVTQKLYAVYTVSAVQAVAVGENGVIVEYNGGSWNVTSSGQSADLFAVCGTHLESRGRISTQETVVVAGAGGLIQTYLGGRLQALRSEARTTLYGLWGLDSYESSMTFAVGKDAMVLELAHHEP